MRLSEIDPKSVLLVQKGQPVDSGDKPLKLSEMNDGDVTLVQHGPSVLGSTLRGGVSGATVGLNDEISGLIGAFGRLHRVKNLGSVNPFNPDDHYESTSEPLSVDEIMKAYRDNRDAIRDVNKTDMEVNPKATIAGNVVGSIVSPASKIAAPAKIFGPMTKMQGLIQASKTAALQGATYGAGNSDSDLTKGEVGQFAKDTALGAGIGLVVPPALTVAGKTLGAGARGAAFVGKKVGASLLSNTESNISKYLANPDRINSAKSLNEIKEIVDESVGKLRDAVDQGKLTESEAKEALKSTQDQVTRGLADKKMDAKDAARAAETLFNDARDKVLTPIKNIKAPTDRAADVSAMVGDLKQKVMDQSRQALETLKPGDRADLSVVYNSIDESLARLKGAGTDEADQVAAKLQAYKERLMQKHWAKIDSQEAKKLIQGLDEITTYSPMAGSFDQAKNKVFKGVRSSLDQSLKEGSPEYRAAMEPVAKNAQLLESANRAFGSPEVAVGKLGRLNTPKGEFDRATLSQLEQATGKAGAVTKEADAYAQAQRILKDPVAVQKIEQSLPEYQTLRQAMADVARRNPKWTRTQIEQATANQRRELAEATSRRIFAEKQLDPFRSLTPATSENKINTLMRGESKGINNRETFDKLGKQTGNDFSQMADDLAVKQSFEKGATNGSRNTVMGAVIGFAFGGLPGAAAGATLGHTVIDKYGPKVGKAILDGIIKVRNNPTVQTIRGLQIPDSVKAEMEREFKVYMVIKNSGATNPVTRVADQGQNQGREPAAKGEDLWAQKGMDKLGLNDESLLQSKETRRLLIEASDLPKDSKRLQLIKNQLQGMRK